MIRIGTRGSKLALTQTRWVRDRIAELHPDLGFEIVVITTSADRDQTSSLRSAASTGVFVKELEEALLGHRVDLAVHSMKDLPTADATGLRIAATPAREDARDALIARSDCRSLLDLPHAGRLGTGSLRRAAQVLAARPDLQVRDIRGNVDTRLRKLESGDYDAIILACAGLNRLGLAGRISCVLGFDEMLPAPGQGALALQTRQDDEAATSCAQSIHDPATAAAVEAERSFLRRLGGGCNIPVGVHAACSGEQLRIDALVAAADGSRVLRRSAAAGMSEGAALGARIAEELLAEGGGTLPGSDRLPGSPP